MNENFLNYEQSLALKELGFDEPCLYRYCTVTEWENPTGEILFQNQDCKLSDKYLTKAPLKQQAFRWFREKYDLYSHIRESLGFDKTLEFVTQINGSYVNHGIEDKPINRFETYEEAENACIDKLLDIAEELIKQD